jgi:transketolase N-terminal domain/subunit
MRVKDPSLLEFDADFGQVWDALGWTVGRVEGDQAGPVIL